MHLRTYIHVHICLEHTATFSRIYTGEMVFKPTSKTSHGSNSSQARRKQVNIVGLTDPVPLENNDTTKFPILLIRFIMTVDFSRYPF